MSLENSENCRINEVFADGIFEEIQLTNFGKHPKLLLSNLSNSKIIQLTGLANCGKSLIISAILFAFGQECENPHILIRNGSDFSEVAVTLKNAINEDSFERDKFGDSIVVKRRITRSSKFDDEYSICSGTSRLVVYKTETALKRILNFFKIDIENPLFVISKESLFTNFIPDGSNGRRLYQMFLASLGMINVTDEDELLLRGDLIVKTSNLIESKLRFLHPTFEVRFDHACRQVLVPLPTTGDIFSSGYPAALSERLLASNSEVAALVIGVSYMLLLLEESRLPIKFVDELDVMLEDVPQKARAVTAIVRRFPEYSWMTGQLFIVTKKRIFQPQACLDHRILTVELRNSSKYSHGSKKRAALEA